MTSFRQHFAVAAEIPLDTAWWGVISPSNAFFRRCLSEDDAIALGHRVAAELTVGLWREQGGRHTAEAVANYRRGT